MKVLRNFDNFVNESIMQPLSHMIDSDEYVKSLKDVPHEVIQTSKKIVNSVFDRVRKPKFEYVPNKGIMFNFFVNEQDFKYIDQDEVLTLGKGVNKNKIYDVTLEYVDKITETFEAIYKVKFKIIGDDENNDFLVDDDDENNDFVDEYEIPNPEDLEYFDEDEADNNIKKGKIKLDNLHDYQDFKDDLDEIEY